VPTKALCWTESFADESTVAAFYVRTILASSSFVRLVLSRLVLLNNLV